MLGPLELRGSDWSEMERRVLRIYVNDLGKVAVDHRGARTEGRVGTGRVFCGAQHFRPLTLNIYRLFAPSVDNNPPRTTKSQR